MWQESIATGFGKGGVSGSMALAWVLAVCLTGCQQLGKVTATFRQRPEPSRQTLVNGEQSEEAWPAKLSARQKADIEMAVARSLEAQGNIDGAVKVYLRVVREDASRSDACHRLAVLHDQKGDCRTSESFYQAALHKDPENAELHCDFGYSLYLQNRWPEAEVGLRRAIALKPDLARAHNNLGLLLARTGRHQESLMEFAAAGCGESEARANLDFAISLQRRWEAAHAGFEPASRADPNSIAAQRSVETRQYAWQGLLPSYSPSPTEWTSPGPEPLVYGAATTGRPLNR